MSANHVLYFYGLFSDTWPKWPMCFARKIPQPFSPKFWDPFGVGNGYAVGPEPTEPCGPAWSCGKWQVEQMERGQGHFGGLLSNSRSFAIMVRWYNGGCCFYLGGVLISEWYFTSHSCVSNVSSKDMAFSAGTAEGRQFVFEKGQTTMTSQLAMASSSLLVSGCQRFNRCLTGVGRFHSDGWFFLTLFIPQTLRWNMAMPEHLVNFCILPHLSNRWCSANCVEHETALPCPR